MRGGGGGGGERRARSVGGSVYYGAASVCGRRVSARDRAGGTASRTDGAGEQGDRFYELCGVAAAVKGWRQKTCRGGGGGVFTPSSRPTVPSRARRTHTRAPLNTRRPRRRRPSNPPRTRHTASPTLHGRYPVTVAVLYARSPHQQRPTPSSPPGPR